MTLILSDWLVVALYFIVSAAIGLAYTRKASRSLEDYFVSGRALPWWLAGTSMVATTFAADTPLAVAGLVAKYGVAGNWLWWNGAFSGVLTVFFFARLWRRAGVLTDVEFAELRYGGKPAAVLRGFRALYLALPINLIIMGWVTRAMVTILGVTLDVDPWAAAILLFGVTAVYSIFSGLWGVIVTDAFQFVIAMGGTILLAVFAVESVGGLGVLTEKAAAHFGSVDAAFGVLPAAEQSWRAMVGCLVPRPGAWRRRIRGPANPLGQGRTARAVGDALVHHCTLCLAALALDSGRLRGTHPLS
jgi:Na+/proline symporter